VRAVKDLRIEKRRRDRHEPSASAGGTGVGASRDIPSSAPTDLFPDPWKAVIAELSPADRERLEAIFSLIKDKKRRK
jgi:hypothetical protein